MVDYSFIELELSATLGLRRRPVALIFRDSIPSGIAGSERVEPSGCSYWKNAAGGMTFYTVPGDHCNCALGSHTHDYAVAPERAGELDQALSRMTSCGYVKMEEIPSIPRLKEAPTAIVYAPLGATPSDPDLVIVVTRLMQVMILQEAALRAGVGLQMPPLGQPTCMSLPVALDRGMIACAGCLGNRVYAGLADDELYVLLPGRTLQTITKEAREVAESNSRLTDYYRARLESLKNPPE
jgi:uncharacterized protein (DUF169 family)